MDKTLKSILNGLTAAVVIVDEQLELYYLNRAAMTLFPKAKPGRALKKIVDKPRVLQAAQKVLDEGREAEVRFTAQATVPTLFRVAAAPIKLRGGGKTAMLTFEDVSHIRDAEKMREDFVANVSHELRSPLTALYGFIETLRGPAQGDIEATDRFLGLMQSESERMARLIDDLLSLSKLQASERFVPTDTVDLRDVIDRINTSISGLADKEDKKIKVDLPEDLPLVSGEQDELRQVFQNLVENAVKYSARGTTVKISTCRKKDKKHVCICIKDQGEGISQKHIPRLTERFYRVDKGRSRQKGGTGLGLAIVKHILIRHRGWLDIKSKEGKGSIFSVNLPVAEKNS